MRDNACWIQTFTGKQFWPLDPEVDKIDIHDIAWSLSMQCRYNGHTDLFFSVAEHCVLIAEYVPKKDKLWGLLHDATEAYLCDLPRPIKHVMQSYMEAEMTLMEAVVKRFNLAKEMPKSVKEADNRILHNERMILMKPPPADWGIPGEPLPDVYILGWTQRKAHEKFLDMFFDLI